MKVFILKKVLIVNYFYHGAEVNFTGYIQLCAGQEAGCETAVHATHEMFEYEDFHGVIQIDASNAFNNINRNVLLHNIKILSPEISTFVINCYSKPSRLFITGGKELTSSECIKKEKRYFSAYILIKTFPMSSLCYKNFEFRMVYFQ